MVNVMKDLKVSPEQYREMVEGGQGEILDLLMTRKNLVEKLSLQSTDQVELYALSTVTGGDKYLKERLGLEIKKIIGRVSPFEMYYIEIHNIPEELIPLFMYSNWALQYNGTVIDDFQIVISQIAEIYGYVKEDERELLMGGTFWMDTLDDEVENAYATNLYATFDLG